MNLSRGNFLAVLAGAAVTLSCAGPVKPAGPTDRYELNGEVLRWDPASRLALVRHEDIKNAEGKVWMAAMTMEFPVRETADIAKMKTGLRIKAALFQRPKDFDYWIADVQVLPAASDKP
jgi:Cu/Ag efflux protein CusF